MAGRRDWLKKVFGFLSAPSAPTNVNAQVVTTCTGAFEEPCPVFQH